MSRLEQMLLGTVRKIAADETLSVPERLTAIIRHHIRIVREQNSLPILLLAEASTSNVPALLDKMAGIFGSYLSILTRIIEEGREDGTIDPSVLPDCMALGLVGTPAALAIRHRLLPDDPFEDRVENIWVPFLLGRLKPDHDDGDGDSS